MKRDRVIPATVFGVAVAVLLVHAARYYPYVTDDALISLRYADRLLDGKGLTWTDGEAVEGYTNLLWVLGTAALGALGIDLIDAARFLGVAGFASAIAALVTRHRPTSLRTALPALAGTLAFSATGAVAVWTIGGLEPPLIAGLLAWALVLSEPLLEQERPSARTVLLPGALFGLLCLTRPDAAIFTIAACLGLVGVQRTRSSIRTALLLAALPAAMVAAQLAFRLAYYGAWIPNTAHQRLSFSAQHIAFGGAYTWAGLWPMAGLVLPALAALAVAMSGAGGPEVQRRVVYLAAPLVLWTGWVTLIGGDYLPGRRHAVPTVLLLAFLATETWAWWVRGGGWPRAVAAWSAALASLAVLAAMQLRLDPEYHRVLEEQWAWDGEAVGHTLAAAFADRQPLMAVDSAGCLPYFSELPALDMLGLNDRYLATHPPKAMGRGTIGHELGDGRYVLGREPDLVIFCLPTGGVGACFASGQQMMGQPEFAEHYRLQTFVSEEPKPRRTRIFAHMDSPLVGGGGPRRVRAQVYLRVDSPRIGVVRQTDQVVVPPWLFTGDRTVTVHVDEGLYVQLADHPARLSGLDLPPGEWRAEVDGSALLAVTTSGTGAPLPDGSAAGSFLAPEPAGATVDLTLTAEGHTHVRSVVLTRSPSPRGDVRPPAGPVKPAG